MKMTNRFLKENTLLAFPFDKGTGICVMKQTYQQKMNDILSLSQFLKEIPTRKNSRELVLKEGERINSELITLNKNGKIDDELLEDLRSTGGQLPRLYGTAKVHKQKRTYETSLINASFTLLQHRQNSNRMVVSRTTIKDQ